MAKKHPLISRTVEKRVLDRAIYLAAFAGPLTALPQIYQIFSTQQADGISIWFWLMGTGFSVIWLAHGIFYRLKPIIVTQTLWIAMNLIVIFGIMLYNSHARIPLSYESLTMLNMIGKTAAYIGIAAGIAAFAVYLMQVQAIRRASR